MVGGRLHGEVVDDDPDRGGVDGSVGGQGGGV